MIDQVPLTNTGADEAFPADGHPVDFTRRPENADAETEVVQALARMAIVSADYTRRAHTAGWRRLLGHLSGGPAPAPSASSARCPSSRSPPTGTRRSSATAAKSSGCASPAPSSRRGAGDPRRGPGRPAASRWRGCPPNHPVWKDAACDGAGRSATLPRSATCSAASTRRPPTAPTSPPGSRPTTSSTRSGSSRTWSPRPARTGPRAALRALVETTRTTKRALVHGDFSPKNLLVGPPAGDPRRRVRVVRRPGLRPRLRAQPPAAEGARRPQWRARYAAMLRRARRRLLRAVALGGAGGAARADAALLPGLCSPASTASRRSNT